MSTLEERVAALEAKVAAMGKAPSSSGAGEVANDYEMSGEHGDPEVKKDPPRWTGDSCVGLRYSQCPVAFLENLAGFLDWEAGKNAEDPTRSKYVEWDRKDARRARGWAARIKAGFAPPPEGGADDESLPF